MPIQIGVDNPILEDMGGRRRLNSSSSQIVIPDKPTDEELQVVRKNREQRRISLTKARLVQLVWA